MSDPRDAERGRSNESVAKVVRYGLATIGPVGTAGAQFLLSLQMLHTLDASAFGSFSFLLVTSIFSCGVWSALFCAPLPILVTSGSEERRETMLRCLITANGVSAALAGFAFWLLELSLGIPHAVAPVFAAFAGVALLRWFARQYAYLAGRQMRTVASDMVYTLALLAGMIVARFLGAPSLQTPFAILLCAAALSLVPFGRKYLLRQFVELSLRDLPHYAEVWRLHSSWSLLGVVTTEATGNAHAYFVTILVGPLAFAPLSASGLLIRPISVVMNALTDFERPQLARQIQSGRLDAAVRSLRVFRLVLIAAWGATAAAAVALMCFAPRLIFPPRYSMETLALGAAIWMAIAFVRLMRMPESAMLQAVGIFRPLALASLVSSGVSVPIVGLLLALGGPLISLLGILIGEATFAVWIHRQARIWRKSRALASTVAAETTQACAPPSIAMPALEQLN